MSSQSARRRPRLVVFTLITTFVILSALAAAPTGKGEGPWKAPARAARKKNPVAADEASVKAGKTVWAAECADCHGARGVGDGPGARDLKSPVPDLTKADVWRQSDGELFWKLSTGRGDMPGFDDMLEESDRWHVLNYARSAFAPRGGDPEVAAGRDGGKEEGKR